MRPIWSGSISFGLINIPVHLYPATNEQNIDFDYLHKKDLSPVRYAKICEREEKEISYKELVRGFAYKDDNYVEITDEDLKRASPQKTKAIQILSFTKEDEVSTEYYEKPYYVEPEKNAQKAYFLLHEALRESGKVAIARFVLRARESLAVLKPHANVLVLNKIRFSDEIRPFNELAAPKDENVSKSELDMAIALVNQLTKKFDPDEYQDTYREELEKTIAAKVKGKPLPEVPEEKPKKVKDLMSLLRESLEEGSATSQIQT